MTNHEILDKAVQILKTFVKQYTSEKSLLTELPDIKNVDPGSEILNIPPVLWNFLFRISATIREDRDWFTIASFDNLDKNQSYSVVGSGKDKSGFHGTTIQTATPCPSLPTTVDISVNIDSFSDDMVVDSSRDRDIPINIITAITNPNDNIGLPSSIAENRFSHLTLLDFDCSSNESKSYVKFKEDMNRYGFSKFNLQEKHISVPGVKTFFSLPTQDTEKSSFTSIAVLDETADKKETVLQVLNLLHEKFQIGSQLRFTLLFQSSLAALTYYLPYRAETLHNLKTKLLLENDMPHHTQHTTPYVELEERNIQEYFCHLQQSSLFSTGDRLILHHIFTDTDTTAEQTDSLMRYRQFGQEELANYFIQLPRAICDAEGVPEKGQKSWATTVFKKLYPESFLTNLPVFISAAKSLAFIIDAMFIINTSPLSIHKTFSEYAAFLFELWVVRRHHQLSASEVHIIFDHPNRNGVSPKDLEQSRRDTEIQSSDYEKDMSKHSLASELAIFYWCQNTKRLLVNFLSDKFLQLANEKFSNSDFLLVTAGGFDNEFKDKALCSKHGSITEYFDAAGDHEEADTRVWLHAVTSSAINIIIYRPDTDVYFIGGSEHGLLCDINSQSGLHSFYRLISAVYFSRHCSAFLPFSSPKTLFDTLNADTINEKHLMLISDIREKMWERILTEVEIMPNADALKLHWQRCCWVFMFWSQASTQFLKLPSLSDFGWQIIKLQDEHTDGQMDRHNGHFDSFLRCVWDSDVNLLKVEDYVALEPVPSDESDMESDDEDEYKDPAQELEMIYLDINDTEV
ncbi:unnamed protein product [Mytilus coruscus]|uniref:Uncharacterized protein n=1 Tax=Mytilus coruscus TaxID=42192 RepID=A0A6J8A0G9_MYTCO|nr:unnamed protein product [Mytilus coruscus]